MLMMSIFDPTTGSYSLGRVLLRRNTLYMAPPSGTLEKGPLRKEAPSFRVHEKCVSAPFIRHVHYLLILSWQGMVDPKESSNDCKKTFQVTKLHLTLWADDLHKEGVEQQRKIQRRSHRPL